MLCAAGGGVCTAGHAAAAAQEPPHHAQGGTHQQEEDVQVVTPFYNAKEHLVMHLNDEKDFYFAFAGCILSVVLYRL